MIRVAVLAVVFGLWFVGYLMGFGEKNSKFLEFVNRILILCGSFTVVLLVGYAIVRRL